MSALRHVEPVEAEPEAPSSIDDVVVLMRRLRDARSRIAETSATAEAERVRLRADLERVDAWEAAETAGDRGWCRVLEAKLAGFLRDAIAAGTTHGKKSVSTPYGRVALRALPPEYRRDDTVLRSWAGEAGYMRVKTTEEVDWERIKKDCHVTGNRLVTADGEVIPGVEVVEREATVTVEVGE